MHILLNELIEGLVKDCKVILGDDLICILLIGSVQRNDINPFSDVDLIIVINQLLIKKMAKLRMMIRNKNILLDMPFVVLEEIPRDPNKFRIGAHGCYYLELVLKNAKPIFGKNVFLNWDRPSLDNLHNSILEKIVQYIFEIRRIFLESNRPISIEQNHKINVRLLKVIKDILLIIGAVDINTSNGIIVRQFFKEYPKVLTNCEKDVITSLYTSDGIHLRSSDMSEFYLENRFIIANKLYSLAINLKNG